MFNLFILNFYLINSFEIYRDGIMSYRESTHKISSHSENFYIFTKIIKFYLNYIIAVFYTPVLVLLH